MSYLGKRKSEKERDEARKKERDEAREEASKRIEQFTNSDYYTNISTNDKPLSYDKLYELLELSENLFGVYDDVKQNHIHLADWETRNHASYEKLDTETDKPIFDAAGPLSRFNKEQLDSFLMPSSDFIDCIPIVDDASLAATTKLLEKQADAIQYIDYSIKPDVVKQFEKWKFYNHPQNSKKKRYKNTLIVKHDPYFIPSAADCHFKLKPDVITKLQPYIVEQNEYIEYTIDLSKIDEDNKPYFKKLATIPTGLYEYVTYTYTPENCISLPTYCVVTSMDHSSLYLNIPGGIQYVIGFAPLTMRTYYDGTAVKNNPRYFPEYPGRMFGIDRYSTGEYEAETDNIENWITAIGYITPAILDRIKKMLDSVTLIKFKTIDDCIIGDVDVCFFESTAEEPKYDNNFSYRSKRNCFGMISYILGFTLNESNYRKFYTSTNKNKEDQPLYLKSLEYAIITEFMNASSAQQQFDIIRKIQLNHTLYNYQEDIFGEPSDLYKKILLRYLQFESSIWKQINYGGGKSKHNKTKAKHNKTKNKKQKRVTPNNHLKN